MKRGPKLSRRTLLQHLSVPSIAAGMGSLFTSRTALARVSSPGDQNSNANVFNIRSFGAKGDGVTRDTVAVQTAIDAASRDGGAIVLVPTGDFIIGTVELKSNVTLHLSHKGRLLGSPSLNDYKTGNGIPPSNGNVVMLSAADAENIRIEGSGTIDGNGAKFFTGRGDMTGPGQNSAEGYFQRPHLLVFYRCKNLAIKDCFLTASAYHCVRILQCSRVILDAVRILNRVNLNNDGFHINSSQYVHIVNCDVVCQDDACALFGSNKFVTVSNSTFSTRWSVFRFGGGEAENITIDNCIIYDTYGCPIKMRCGSRSRFEDIRFSNLVLKNVTGPISIGLDSARRNNSASVEVTATERGKIRGIAFNGIRAVVTAEGKQHPDLPWPQKFRPGETRQCIVLNGAGDNVIEDISFHDVHVTYEGGGTTGDAERKVPQLAGEYFEIGTPPAYGIYARNVRGLQLGDVRFALVNPDCRPALVFENVADANVNSLSVHGSDSSVIRLTNSRDIYLTSTRVITAANAFLNLVGNNNQAITVDGGDLSRVARPLMLTAGATSSAVKLR